MRIGAWGNALAERSVVMKKGKLWFVNRLWRVGSQLASLYILNVLKFSRYFHNHGLLVLIIIQSFLLWNQKQRQPSQNGGTLGQHRNDT